MSLSQSTPPSPCFLVVTGGEPPRFVGLLIPWVAQRLAAAAARRRMARLSRGPVVGALVIPRQLLAIIALAPWFIPCAATRAIPVAVASWLAAVPAGAAT
jgi:hypothetical protein